MIFIEEECDGSDDEDDDDGYQSGMVVIKVVRMMRIISYRKGMRTQPIQLTLAWRWGHLVIVCPMTGRDRKPRVREAATGKLTPSSTHAQKKKDLDAACLDPPMRCGKSPAINFGDEEKQRQPSSTQTQSPAD
jgi:hypothetical protein